MFGEETRDASRRELGINLPSFVFPVHNSPRDGKQAYRLWGHDPNKRRSKPRAKHESESLLLRRAVAADWITSYDTTI
jgi:hypothetical protein